MKRKNVKQAEIGDFDKGKWENKINLKRKNVKKVEIGDFDKGTWENYINLKNGKM